MNFTFADAVRRAFGMAREEAGNLGHEYVGTEHLLLGLLREPEGRAAPVLTKLNTDIALIKDRLGDSLRRGTHQGAGELPYTSRARKSIEYAMEECRDLHRNEVSTEHLLLGLLREEKGIAAVVLNSVGVTLDGVRSELANLPLP